MAAQVAKGITLSIYSINFPTLATYLIIRNVPMIVNNWFSSFLRLFIYFRV